MYMYSICLCEDTGGKVSLQEIFSCVALETLSPTTLFSPQMHDPHHSKWFPCPEMHT